jgi:ribosomal protein S6
MYVSYAAFLFPTKPASGASPKRGDVSLRTYELVLIAQPELDVEGLDALVDSIQQVIADNGGEVMKVERMGKRKLAYSIEKHFEGHYVLLHTALERPIMLELERRLKLSEDVLRYLLVRLDGPIAETSPAIQEETPSSPDVQEA